VVVEPVERHNKNHKQRLDLGLIVQGELPLGLDEI